MLTKNLHKLSTRVVIRRDQASIAGRSVLSTFRALNDYRFGNRSGPSASR